MTMRIVPPTEDRLRLLASDRTGLITYEELAAIIASGAAFVCEMGEVLFALMLKNGELWVLATRNDGGAPADWAAADEGLRHLASRLSARVIRFMGRTGWARRLRDLGYEQTGVIMEKEVPQ